MDYLKLKKAVAEARRFIEAAEDVQVEDTSSAHLVIMKGRKENATCRRASLDLSRALSELRKPG